MANQDLLGLRESPNFQHLKKIVLYVVGDVQQIVKIQSYCPNK